MGTIKVKDPAAEAAKILGKDMYARFDESQPLQPVTENAQASEIAGALYEEKSLRSENSKCWRMNNGTMRQIITANALHYCDDNGELCEIDNRLNDGENFFEANNGAKKVRLSKSAQSGELMRIEKGNTELSWQYCKKSTDGAGKMKMRRVAAEQTVASAVEKADSGVIYENVENGVDIEYELCGTGVKENIIVREKRDEYRFDFRLNAKGYKVVLSEDARSIELYVGDKREYIIPEPFMYDADGVLNNEVYYEMEKLSDEQYLFSVVAEPTWINDENRAMPVTIDPYFVTSEKDLFSMRTFVQTCSNPYWKEYDSYYLRIANSSTTEKYKGEIVVKKSYFPLHKQKIIKVMLVLKAYSFSGSGGIKIDDKVYRASMGNIEIDITEKFVKANSYFTLELLPSGNMDLTVKSFPSFEIEYYVKENTKPCKRKYDFIGGVSGELDITTGDFVATFPDVQSSDNVLNYGISHVYKKSKEDFGCGGNFRLNLHEKLERSSESLMDGNFVYTDAYGDKYVFREYFYYINDNNERCNLKKEEVTIELDGTLFYDNGHNKYKVYKEERSATGLKAITCLEGNNFINKSLYDERQKEIKQLEDTIKAYESTFDKYKIIKIDSENYINCMQSYFKSKELFDKFINSAKEIENILLYDNEIVTYQILCKQLKIDSKQKDLIILQKKYYEEKTEFYIEQLKDYYKEYVNACAECNKRKRYTPVNYIVDGNIYKGFNYNGDLVVISDLYKNALIVVWEENERISAVYDNVNNGIVFNYDGRNRLTSIVDMHGRRTEYYYDNKGYLERVSYSSGKEVGFVFTDSFLSGIYMQGLEYYSFEYTNNKLDKISKLMNANKISHGNIEDGILATLYEDKITYSAFQTFIVRNSDIKISEAYKLNAVGNVYEYYKKENDKIVQAEQYNYEEYVCDNVVYAPKEELNKTLISEVSFEGGDYKYTNLDEYNNPISILTNWVKIGSQTQPKSITEQKVEVYFFYNESHRVKKEIKNIFTRISEENKEPQETIKQLVKHYSYNAQENIVRTESYNVKLLHGRNIIDETAGRVIEETVYDEKGHAVKSFKYNSLDSSSKIYTESEYAEDGKVTAEIDETGENKTALEYVNGTGIVRSKTLPNGSKFAYGYNMEDNVTAITHSTEEGEENSTQTAYTGGEITELRSGNNVVRYEYDYKRRKSAIDLNDTKDYVKIIHEDVLTDYVKTGNKTTQTYVRRDTHSPID